HADTTLVFSVKKPSDFQGEFLVGNNTDFAKNGTGTSTYWSISPNFNTTLLNNFLVNGTVKLNVANAAARLALTQGDGDEEVANGDIVGEDDTKRYYVVIDETKLDEDD